MPSDLDGFFTPRSVAIVGASREPHKVGHEVLANLIAGGYEGAIYPVNPHARELLGLRCYEDLRAIGQAPDLVVICIPAPSVPKIMRQCANVGVKAVVIITAGFKEVGEAGAALEREVVEIARSHGIRVIGPNCLGLLAPRCKLNAGFGGPLPPLGGIGYISQSGALLSAILDIARTHEIGFSALLSIGNKADVNELDVLRSLGDDADTTVIAGYLESIEDGHAFVQEAEQISHRKPILLLKAGGTKIGARAASSHTGSMAGAESAYESAFARAGVIRCESIKRQFDYAEAFATQPLPAGPRIAVVTNAGGLGVMAADTIEQYNLELAELSNATVAALRDVLPPEANVHNPIDVLGDALPDRFETAARLALADEHVDSLLVLLTPQAVTDAAGTAEGIVKAAREGAAAAKPIFASFLGGSAIEGALRVFQAGRIPWYDSPMSAVRTMRRMVDYVRWRQRPKRVVKLFPINRHRVERIIDRHIRREDWEIGEFESKEILEACGFATPRGSLATTADQAVSMAEQIGYPVVLKIWSPDILHKTEVDGVKLGIDSPQAVRDAFDLMMYRIPQQRPDAQIPGVLVQEMCRGGQEVILGMTRDPRFGPVMMFGLGGIFVETLQDVSFYLAPLTADEARQMLMGTRTYQMLRGTRGREGVDIEAIAEALQRLSQLVTEFPQIQEMDINPLMVGPAGVTPIATDARIRLAHDHRLL